MAERLEAFPYEEGALERLLGLFFPRRCPGCGAATAEGLFCARCEEALVWLEPGYCPLCGEPAGRCACGGRPLGGVAAPFSYHAPAASAAIHRLKFSGHPENSRPLARYMAAALLRRWPGQTFDLVLEVPMTQAAVRRRGYNQSALLARELARLLHLPRVEKVLRKTRSNQVQHTLSRQQRWKNVQGVYSVVDEPKIRGKIVVLVDDIVTTGATMEACAQALRQAGAAQVYGVAAGAVPKLRP